MALEKIEISQQSLNPFSMFGKQWVLVSAGTKEHWNTMTASWGGIGIMWGKPCVFCPIRPSRYTKEFVDREEYFTITLLQDGHRDALNRMGTVSGREVNKMTDSGLTPLFLDDQPTFAEAAFVLVCRKRGCTALTEQAVLHEQVRERWYPDADYHVVYIGEIISAYQNSGKSE